MSTSATFTPPAQPATGTLTLVPLGGDGFTAPQTAYAINNFQHTGTSGGGKNTMTIEMDDRFCSLVSFISFGILQGTSTDAEFRLQVGSSTGGVQIPSLSEGGLVEAISSTVSNQEISKTINLIPMMMPGAGNAGRIQLEFLNIENDVYRISTLIYLFNIRVRELTPMGPLLWARGSS